MVNIKGGEIPKELTAGTQGKLTLGSHGNPSFIIILAATTNPVFSTNGDKVAWLEMDVDGYRQDRYILSIMSNLF